MGLVSCGFDDWLWSGCGWFWWFVFWLNAVFVLVVLVVNLVEFGLVGVGSSLCLVYSMLVLICLGCICVWVNSVGLLLCYLIVICVLM